MCVSSPNTFRGLMASKVLSVPLEGKAHGVTPVPRAWLEILVHKDPQENRGLRATPDVKELLESKDPPDLRVCQEMMASQGETESPAPPALPDLRVHRVAG